MDNKFYHTLYQACDYLSMSGLKLILVSKRGPRFQSTNIHVIKIKTFQLFWWEAEVLVLVLDRPHSNRAPKNKDEWNLELQNFVSLNAIITQRKITVHIPIICCLWRVDGFDIILDRGDESDTLLQIHLPSPLNTWFQYIVQRQPQTETRNI